MKKATINISNERIRTDKQKFQELKDLDTHIINLINAAGITKETNSFFKEARKIKNIDVYPAMLIASNWRELTKTFMFTTLIGVGHFAEEIGFSSSPDKNLLQVLQTSLAVISDDINNVFHVFKEKAPTGPDGIHYIWWENAILTPLRKACNTIREEPVILPATKELTDGMFQLSKDPFGFAIQLRVVEAIALDIVLAFQSLFYAVEVNGKKLFSERSELNWIYSHITAEVVHHQQVKDIKSGMMLIAKSPDDRERIKELANWYINLWANVFDEFYSII